MGSFTPLVILGAPRSGTNMLRDVLTSFEGIGTWPCDEINYIWRHGNVAYPTDEIPAENASAKVVAYIRKQFAAIQQQQQVDVVVEKTCASCLRVPFIDKVLPDAKYVYIYRDGIDAAGSAKLRWSAELDIPYIIKKVRYVPFSDLPYYGIRYFWTRIYRLFSKEKRLAFWGPKFSGMNALLQKHTLNEVCALQWQTCVKQAEAGLSNIAAERVLRVKYEDFVKQPAVELMKVLRFLGKEYDEAAVHLAVKSVSSKSLGKGRQALGDAEVVNLERLVGETLQKYGYV